MFTRSYHGCLSWATWIHSTPAHFNIILPSTPGCPKRFLPLRFAEYNFAFISHSPCMLHSPPISTCLA